MSDPFAEQPIILSFVTTDGSGHKFTVTQKEAQDTMNSYFSLPQGVPGPIIYVLEHEAGVALFDLKHVIGMNFYTSSRDVRRELLEGMSF